MSDNLLTIKEAAEELKVHWQTIRNLIKRKELKSVKYGRSVRIPQEALSKINPNTQTTTQQEIEIRFAVDNPRHIIESLVLQGAEVVYQGHIIDHWFVPHTIKNLAEKNEWFDSAKGFGLRIREQDNGYTGNMHTTLEVKRLAQPNQHDTCLEEEITVPGYIQTLKLLQMANFKEMITVDKNRVVYRSGGFNVAVDTIKDFMTAVEIEMMTDQPREEVLPKLHAFAEQLGLDPLYDQTEKSVTWLAMEQLAKF